MKANRKFIEADERAVSAVIGVILMVAITVAIAATVYVYVSGMVGGTKKMAPSIMFSKDETADRIIVATTDSGVPWTSLSIRATAAVKVFINSDVTGALGVTLAVNSLTAIVQTAVPATNFISGGTSPYNIQGSDFIDIEGGPFTDVTVTMVHTDTSSILQTIVFSSILVTA